MGGKLPETNVGIIDDLVIVLAELYAFGGPRTEVSLHVDRVAGVLVLMNRPVLLKVRSTINRILIDKGSLSNLVRAAINSDSTLVPLLIG